jgi:hypothetical protein
VGGERQMFYESVTKWSLRATIFRPERREMKMKTLIISCILTIPFLAGCSTTYYVPRAHEAEEFVDVREKVHLRHATVTLVDGTEVPIDSTSLHSDSISGMKKDTRIPQVWPLSQVREITIRHFGRGARRGALNGLIWGGALGLAVGVDARTDPVLAQSGEDASLVVVTFAFCGAYVGAMVGMGVLSTEHYEFSEDAAATFSSQETKHWGGRNPRNVLEVEKFLAETDSTVTIRWQEKMVKLPKAEITIEKTEKGYRITVPVRLLQ